MSDPLLAKLQFRFGRFTSCAVLFGSCVVATLNGNPPSSEWQIITPNAAGQATNSSFFALDRAFDGMPAWDASNFTVTGTAGADAPAHISGHGYIDFGSDYDQVHIMETWTRYRSYSGASQPGYIEIWWDDDKDTVNDNGIIETRLNFNNAYGLTHISTEQWFRDKRVNELGGVIPQKRYLIMKWGAAYADRAQEYAIVGYHYDGLVPPEYADALFLSIDANTVQENGEWQQVVGTVSLSGGADGETYSIEFDNGSGDNTAFQLIGDTLWTARSFDYEAQSTYNLSVDAVAATDGARTSLELVIRIADRSGAFDTNGLASVDVAAEYPEINVGDFVIWNPTDRNGPDIRYSSDLLNVSYPNKILIRGGVYSQIIFDLAGVNGIDADRRVPITNFQGQVYANQIGMTNGSYWRLTGQYDPSLGLGDPGFTGCQSPEGDTQFGYSTGTYGIWACNEWVNETNSMIYVSGIANGWEIDHIEVSDGGFAGMAIKKDNGTVDMDEVYLHHLYIHDTGSEGIYLGSTQSDPQHQFNQLTVEKCVALRTGTEAFQLGQLGADCVIRHNVAWGAMDWMSPFQAYQDNCVQLTTRQGGVTFENNILLAGGEKFYNVSNSAKAGITPNGGDITISNNVNWGCRGIAGAYQFPNSDGVTGWEWRNNFFGGFEYTYDLVYPNAYNNLSCVMVPTSEAISVNATDNVYDSTRDQMLIRWASGQAVMSETNNVQKTVLAPRFINLLGLDGSLDILRWKRWSATIGEDASYTNNFGNNNKGDLILYAEGDIVQYHYNGQARFYRCIEPHTNHEPPIDGNQFWELLTWESPEGRLQYCPPDDARLVEGSLYHQLGIGLRGNGLTDSDSDDLPDDWERRHGLNPNSGVGDDGTNGNPDRDARSNLEEYLGNSSPVSVDDQNELSLEIDGVNTRLTVHPANGRAWRVTTSQTLAADDWTPGSVWQSTQGEIFITESMPTDQMFYRMEYRDETQLDLLP